ncbi:flagellar hook-basal body complex protein [Alicyclobacillus fastidiosus]|uniref:Flagellar hook protein FlgE n=1 Tax=Alicyclobacillus fastidiosus TaxID=392011 RepID=A0ABV5AGN6_9BACL|nr:flagellar hook-basal body complex protein [Alicyclobacillus fastidiosus]WEH07921.1 flagellar hook-basal body complex protein [Alicyclobacillus fastidiosus]
MLRSMSSAISGMQAFQTDLDVVGNNIANVNTVGFKSSRTDFGDVLSQTLSGGNAGTTGGLGGTNPQQVGLGVKVTGTQLDMSGGPDQTTSSPTDLAINNAGFFVVKSNTGGATSGSTYLTRAGDFTVDSNDDLVLPNGFVAMGFQGSTAPSATTNETGLVPVNLSTMLAGVAPSGVTLPSSPNVQIGEDGSINVTGSDGKTYTVGYMALGTVPNPAGLEKVGDNMYGVVPSAGQVTYAAPNDTTAGTGTLSSGELEMSNVDLSNEFSEMIVAQNGYVANTHVIGTDSTILQALVNMKNS